MNQYDDPLAAAMKSGGIKVVHKENVSYDMYNSSGKKLGDMKEADIAKMNKVPRDEISSSVLKEGNYKKNNVTYVPYGTKIDKSVERADQDLSEAVGTAALLKKKKDLEDRMDNIVKDGGQLLLTDPLMIRYKAVSANLKKSLQAKPRMKIKEDVERLNEEAEEITHIISFQKGNTVGARSVRMVHVTASDDNDAMKKAEAKYKSTYGSTPKDEGYGLNRVKRMGGKSYSLGEDIEQIDELSPGTLGRYLTKAADNLDHHSSQRTQRMLDPRQWEGGGRSKEVRRLKKDTNYHYQKVLNRKKGIQQVGKKLQKEDAERTSMDSVLQELSKSTLKRYVSGAVQDVGMKMHSYGNSPTKDLENTKKHTLKKAISRTKQIDKAVNKLAEASTDGQRKREFYNEGMGLTVTTRADMDDYRSTFSVRGVNKNYIRTVKVAAKDEGEARTKALAVLKRSGSKGRNPLDGPWVLDNIQKLNEDNRIRKET